MRENMMRAKKSCNAAENCTGGKAVNCTVVKAVNCTVEKSHIVVRMGIDS